MNNQNINRLIDFAIQQEHEAFNFYKAASEKVTNPGVKQLFLELAEEENGHSDLLERYKKNKSLSALFKSPDIDYKISETQDMPPLSVNMKPADAIAVAMKKEQQAAELYCALADKVISPIEKKELENLASMEMGHKQKLENAFINIGYPEVF